VRFRLVYYLKAILYQYELENRGFIIVKGRFSSSPSNCRMERLSKIYKGARGELLTFPCLGEKALIHFPMSSREDTHPLLHI
jgi:hypothetical protein